MKNNFLISISFSSNRFTCPVVELIKLLVRSNRVALVAVVAVAAFVVPDQIR